MGRKDFTTVVFSLFRWSSTEVFRFEKQKKEKLKVEFIGNVDFLI